MVRMLHSRFRKRHIKCVVGSLSVFVVILCVVALVKVKHDDVTINYNLYYYGYHRNDVIKVNVHGETSSEQDKGRGSNQHDGGVASLGNALGFNDRFQRAESLNNERDDVTKWTRDARIAANVWGSIHDNNYNNNSNSNNVFEMRALSEEASLALDIAMTRIDIDKGETREVELTSHGDGDATWLDDDVMLATFIEYGEPGYPGENGTGVQKDTFSHLTREERRQKRKDFYINNFDVWVSRKIPLHRSLYEARSPSCQVQQYPPLTTTLTVSVVIVFYNEAWTTLLRSVHSVLDTSPKDAITEIILLDDCSTQDHLKSPLERYLKTHMSRVVRLVRSAKRLGLVKARNVGFRSSKGDIVVFLDSHIECFQGWFEPLIAPILSDRTIVTFPTIQVISTRSFQVIKTKHVHVGSLNIDTLAFAWRKPDQNNHTLYYRSPTMPGGLYAVSRQWFHRLGAYDTGLEVWGAENIEISLKTWMCGGSILLSTCSNIAHVFRSSLPLVDPSLQEKIHRNRQRVAEVWMDDYKHFHYEKLAYNLQDFGDLTNQKRLRMSLQCQDFRWYLDHVNPLLKTELDVEGVYSGQIRHVASGLCLQSDNVGPLLMTCRPKRSNQVWQLTTNGHLSSLDMEMSVLVEPIRVSAEGRWRRVKARIKELTGFESYSHRNDLRRDDEGDGGEAKENDWSDEMTSRHNNVTSALRHYMLLMTHIPRDSASQYSVTFHYDQKRHLVHGDSRLCMENHPDVPSIRLSACGDEGRQEWSVQMRQELRSLHGAG